MRLWHQKLIPFLPRQQLLGQHRECCALRGKSWGKKHSTVNYVFSQPYEKLFAYHFLVMREMQRRGYKVTPTWWEISYRGKNSPRYKYASGETAASLAHHAPVYEEHNQNYLRECLENLKGKGITINEF